MKFRNKTKAQNSGNVAELHQRLAFLEAAETKRLRVEEAPRESKERFRNLVETIKHWIWEVDAQGLYTYVSPMELIADRFQSEKQ
jgi:PAS domain-containing protein